MQNEHCNVSVPSDEIGGQALLLELRCSSPCSSSRPGVKPDAMMQSRLMRICRASALILSVYLMCGLSNLKMGCITLNCFYPQHLKTRQGAMLSQWTQIWTFQ